MPEKSRTGCGWAAWMLYQRCRLECSDVVLHAGLDIGWDVVPDAGLHGGTEIR